MAASFSHDGSWPDPPSARASVDLKVIEEAQHDEPIVLGERPTSPRNKIQPGFVAGADRRRCTTAPSRREMEASQDLAQEVAALREEVRTLLHEHRHDVRELLKEELQKVQGFRSRIRGSTPTGSRPPTRVTTEDQDEGVEQKPPRIDHVTSAPQSEELDEGVHTHCVEPMTFEDAVMHVAPQLATVAARLKGYFNKLPAGDPPERTDIVSRIVDSAIFHLIIYTTIIANVVFMCYAADEEIEHYLEGISPFVFWGEVVFQIIYSVELIMRLWRERCFFWYGREWLYNWLDLFILIVSYVTLWLPQGGTNVSWLRMFRLLKLAKVMRIFRLVAKFKVLRAIMVSLVETIGTLCWSGILLYLVLFTFALTFTLMAGNYMSHKGEDLQDDEKDALTASFGTVVTSTLTLYMCALGGADWGPFHDAAHLIGPLSGFLFVVFIFFTEIAVLNIILGLFVNQAMKSMEAEREEASYQHAMEEYKAEKDLTDIIRHADSNGSGQISIEEWRDVMTNTNAPAAFDLLGLKPQDVMTYYKKLSKKADGGDVDIERFTRGCLIMKGPASKFDIHGLAERMDALEEMLRDFAYNNREPVPER